MKKRFILVITLLVACSMFSAAQGNKKVQCTQKSNWDEPPAVVKNYPIKYPEDAQKGKIEGTIYFKVMIDVDGKVTNVEVIKKNKATESMITEAGNAVKQYIFTPAKRKGKSVESTVTIPIKFKLE